MRNTNEVEILDVATQDYEDEEMVGQDSKCPSNIQLYMKNISVYPLLSKEEEVELSRRILEGDESAKEELVNCNLRLVVHIAKQYQHRGLDFADLIQEGNCGLEKAASKFDCRLGNRFSTYATYWIQQDIRRAIINNSRLIRLPSSVIESINKMYRYENDYIQQYGYEPSLEEIANEMKISVKNVAEIKQAAFNTTSLDKAIDDDGDTCIGDLIADTSNITPVEYVNKSFLREKLEKAINNLNEVEQKVIRCRYGFDDNWVKTFEEVADRFGVSRERVRQIEGTALTKLRKYAENHDLNDIYS